MRKGSRPQSRQRSSPLTPSPFPTLDVQQSSSSSPATQVSATSGGEAGALVALHVAVNAVRNIRIVLRVGVQSPQLEREVRELKLKLRRAEAAAEAAVEDARRRIADKEAEVLRGRRFNRLWRTKYMELKGKLANVEQVEEGEEEEEEVGGGEEEEEDVGGDDDEEEGAEEEEDVEEEAAPEHKVYAGRKQRQVLAKQVWKLIWDLVPACAAGVLVLAAYRASALGDILRQKTLQRQVNALRRRTVEETRAFLMENQLAPEKWCKWMLQSHVSLAKVNRLRSFLCFDDVPVEIDGEETIDTKVALQMHKDFAKPTFKLVPSQYRLQKCIRELLEGESAVSKVGTVDGVSIRGATMSVTRSILKLIFEAEDRGNLTRDGQYSSSSALVGTIEGILKHNIAILIAGDGFSGKGLKVRGKIVRMGCSLLSQTGWNCSPDDWLDFASWSGGESWAQIDFFMDDLEQELRGIEEAGGAVVDANGTVRHISLLVGGDKPWILDFCGKMNMNAMYPFVYCTCSQEQAKEFNTHPAAHDWIDADRAARLAHVCPEWRWQGKTWKNFVCEVDGCTLGENDGNLVTQKSHDELMERITELPAKEQAKEVARIARMHYCFKPGKTAAFRWLRILPDPMHAIMNILEPIIRHGIWKQITYDAANVHQHVKEVKDLAMDVMNNACRKYRIQITFYNDENGMPRISGNATKRIMASGILDVWIRAVSPVLRLALPHKHTSPRLDTPQAAVGPPEPVPKRRKKSISDAMQAALARASSSASVECPMPPVSQQLEDEQHTVEDQLEVLLATSLAELTDVWNFLTDKNRDPQDEPARNAWREEFFELAKSLGQTSSKIVGQCTYTHDLAYGVWHGSIIIGAYLRASMEGFEHANKDMGAIYRNQVVVGGKAGREGGKRHESVQALELRRATTSARLEDCFVNKLSHATLAAASDEPLKKRIDTTEAQALLLTLKSELELMNLCAPCSLDEVKQTLNDLKK